jgi:diguanylate cyclase (GGDEF)-like protein/PAS domain S-box-containing protein
MLRVPRPIGKRRNRLWPLTPSTSLLGAAQRRPIRSLVLIGAVLAAAVAIATALTLTSLRRGILSNTERQLHKTAYVLAEHTDRGFQSLDLIQASLIEQMRAMGIASAEELEQRMSGHEVHLMLAEKLRAVPHADAITMINRDGKLINFSRYWPIPQVNVADRDYFKALSTDSALTSFISQPAANRGTGTWTIYLARKFTGADGEFLGLVLGAIRLDHFEAFYAKVARGPDDQIVLRRVDGTLLVQHPRLAAPGETTPPAAAAGPGEAAAPEQLTATHALAHYPIEVTTATTVAAALAEWRLQVSYLVALASGLVLVIGGIGALAVQWFRQQSLRLDVTLNNLSQGVCFFDGAQRLIVCNRRYVELYRIPAERIVPGITLREIVDLRYAAGSHPAMTPDEYLAWRDRIAVADTPSDTLVELHDGRIFEIRHRPMPGHGWVATHEDVTARCLAEKSLAAAKTDAERAEHEARVAHGRLINALEVIPEGLAMFDADDRLALWNRRYAELYPESREALAVGTPFEDLLRLGIRKGQYPEAADSEEEWLRDRLARHHAPQSSHEQRLSDDRWVRVEERRTADGGSIGIRVDITELKRREASFRLLFLSNPVPMYLFDRETLRFLDVNDAAVAHYGHSRERFLEMSMLDIRPAEDREEIARVAAQPSHVETGRIRRHLKADGSEIKVAIYTRSLRYEGHVAGLVAAVDLTERQRVEDELRATREFLDAVVENVPVAIDVKEPREHRYVLINRAAEEFWGLGREEMIGRRAHEIFPGTTAEILEANWKDLVRERMPALLHDFAVDTPGRGMRLARIKRHPVFDQSGEPRLLLSVIEDVTEHRRTEAQIAHMARHDALTDLPNRAAFNDYLALTIDRAAVSATPFAVLCLDLDRFKDVNDVFGHSIGDALLQAATRRLRDACGTAFLARIGGDEFNLVTTDLPQPAAARVLAERLTTALAADFNIDGIPLQIGLSVGAAVFPDNGMDAKTLLANADAALYRAKADGRSAVRFFDSEMDQRLHEKRLLQQELRNAIARDEFELHYQPQARIGGEIFGFEALVRWTHPTRGLVSPGRFIPIAEESGLIGPLSEWILLAACREAASWPRPLQIAVNISANQFRHGDLAGLVHSVLLQTGLSPQRLELEITEGVLVDDIARALSVLRRIKALGVRIAMDDFGTGYSSLSYLQAFPFDKMKIDQSFVSGIENGPQSTAIIRAVIGLARGLDLPVLAEGVETPQQLAYLAREGCDEVQGFLLGRPLPIASYAAIVGEVGFEDRVVRLSGR